MQKETGCSSFFIREHLSTLKRNETHLLSMEIILTNNNSELLIFEGYAYIKHRTLSDNCFLGAAHDVVATDVYVQKKTSLRSLKITATSPIQVISKNVSSENT